MSTFVMVVPQLRTIRGQDRFTYKTDLPLQLGEIVRIPWRKQVVNGVIVVLSAEPHARAKMIIETTGIILPRRYLDFLHWLAVCYHISEPAAVLAALPDEPAH